MIVTKIVLTLALLCANISFGYTTQRASVSSETGSEEDSNPLLDIASMFVQQALNSQESGGGGGNRGAAGAGAGLGGVASLIGTVLEAATGGQGKGASGAMDLIAGIGSLLTQNSGSSGNNGDGDSGGFDPSIIGNVIELFTNSADGIGGTNNEASSKRSGLFGDSGIGLDTMVKMISMFSNSNKGSHKEQGAHMQKRSLDGEPEDNEVDSGDNGLMSLLPLVMQAVSSFTGPEGQHTQEKHKDHAWVLPPFLEHIHVLWDHFSNSELADALYEKSGINTILKGFKGRDGKLDYDKLFESLNNQSFRRRWIKAATVYLADWASYLANPDVYLKYLQTAQIMFNGFLKSQGYPKKTFFDPSRASETISNLMDHVAKHHLDVVIDSRQYVKPAVSYGRELLKLGQARGLLQFNTTELSDKLTDTLNLEVIEPVLKVHRAYRYIGKTPQCDRYVLCQLNSVEQNAAAEAVAVRQSSSRDDALISGVSSKIVRIGSMGAAIFISTETGTPFWTLFGVINSPYNCEAKYPVDCSGFHHGEAKVTTEYIHHNEL